MQLIGVLYTFFDFFFWFWHGGRARDGVCCVSLHDDGMCLFAGLAPLRLSVLLRFVRGRGQEAVMLHTSLH